MGIARTKLSFLTELFKEIVASLIYLCLLQFGQY